MSKKPVVYDAFNLPPDVPQIFEGSSLTRQEFSNSGNLNVIVAEFARTGIPPDLGQRPPVYADVSRVPTFQEAQNIIIHATNAFNDLPAKVRKRLKTPAEFMEFIHNPENEDEARRLGILNPKPATATTPAEPLVAAPAATPAP